MDFEIVLFVALVITGLIILANFASKLSNQERENQKDSSPLSSTLGIVEIGRAHV